MYALIGNLIDGIFKAIFWGLVWIFIAVTIGFGWCFWTLVAGYILSPFFPLAADSLNRALAGIREPR